MRHNVLPMKLQFFAEGGEGGDGGQQSTGGNQTGNEHAQQNQSTQEGTVDYNKIQQMLDTATSKKENAVLSSYFKQQGLSEDEVKQAIASFKETKQQQSQKQQTDNAQLQTQVAEAQQVAEKAQIELEATKVGIGLGLDIKTLPYMLKLADLSTAKDKDGKINTENIKAAFNKVLEDMPALKGDKQENKGFQIGAGQQTQQQTNTTKTTATKRWNKFN